MDQPPLDPFVDPPWTLAEFEEFLQDQPEGERWELLDGRIYRLMTGGTIAHNAIIQNISFELTAGLRRRSSLCRVFSENVQVVSVENDVAFYPDVIVTCEKTDPNGHRVHKPIVIVEVVSRTSRERDETAKRDAYRQFPSLRHYVIVEQSRIGVKVTSRQADGSWGWQVLESVSDRIRFPEIEAELSLAEIYARVFDQPV